MSPVHSLILYLAHGRSVTALAGLCSHSYVFWNRLTTCPQPTKVRVEARIEETLKYVHNHFVDIRTLILGADHQHLRG